MPGYRIAIVGATGLVGQTLLTVLEDRRVPVDVLVPLARDGGGRSVTFDGQTIPVEPLDTMDWQRVDAAFFAAGNAVSAEYAAKAIEHGVTIIDKASFFRMHPDVPLVVPEVNASSIGDARLIASPNCSTIQLVCALAPLERHFGIERVVVSTYQAVSGTGREAVEELEQQVQDPDQTARVYPAPIAHNVLPFCDKFGDADYTGEEWKLMRESAKILGRDVHLSATAVRVPVYVGHAESVYLETRTDWTLDAVRTALREGPSVRIVDNPESGLVPTPRAAAGQDDVLVGRIRQDLHHPRGLHLFVVADNLRRGAATNAIDILCALGERWGVVGGDRACE